MNQLSVKLSLYLLCLLVATWASQGAMANPQQPHTKAVDEEPNIVAKIGDYVITKQELKDRLIRELGPDDYGNFTQHYQPPDANTVLLKMIAEKAMIIEARKANFLQRETIRASLKRFEQRQLVNLLLQKYVKDKLTVTDSEVDEKIKANPRLDRARVKAMLERRKANQLVNEYYSQLYKKFHVQKQSDNFPKAAQIHQRLLLHPKEPRRANFIRIRQIEEELTPEEKNLPLATYDNGKVTLKDWLDALCEMSPPSRPKDLHTPQGVERLLDRALSVPLFVAEARLQGLDKDKNFLARLRKQEDIRLLYAARSDKVKDISGPISDEQIIAYYNKNKEAFGTPKMVKIDQIWCQDKKAAQQAKAELDAGKDFDAVRQEYSLEKSSRPFYTYPGGERMFFEDLYKAEPNDIVGPIKGFYRNGFKWRVVKILEKKPGEIKEYSADMKRQIEWRILEQQRNEALARYRKELLNKYSYQIYADRIKDINPLNIP